MSSDRAWMYITIDGDAASARMHTVTNDNFDRGYPSDHASWTDNYRATEYHPDALALACKHAGVSRVGISGITVEVTVNGERV